MHHREIEIENTKERLKIMKGRMKTSNIINSLLRKRISGETILEITSENVLESFRIDQKYDPWI